MDPILSYFASFVAISGIWTIQHPVQHAALSPGLLEK